MRQQLVVDASVAIKWFKRLQETQAEEATSIFRAHGDGIITITVPEIFFYEIPNVLIKRYKFPSEEVKDFDSALYGLSVVMVGLTKPLLELAIQITNRFDLSFYDAMYFAVAQSLDIDCVTADEKAYQSIRTSLPFVKLLSDYR